jgi:hypothetical protein
VVAGDSLPSEAAHNMEDAVAAAVDFEDHIDLENHANLDDHPYQYDHETCLDDWNHLLDDETAVRCLCLFGSDHPCAACAATAVVETTGGLPQAGN